MLAQVKKVILLAILLMLHLNALANVDSIIYKADYSASSWGFSQTNESCHLHHTIPGYGEVSFQKKASLPVDMNITSIYRLPMPIKDGVTLKMEHPSWQHDKQNYTIGKMNLARGNQVIYGASGIASAVLTGLQNGFEPSFYHQNWIKGKGDIKLVFSPVNFQKAYQQFVYCTEHLPLKSFREMHFNTVYFDQDSTDLDFIALQKLTEITEYVKKINDVVRIKLAGFSDNSDHPLKNKKIAERRAETVQHYFTQHGIAKEKFVILVYGEKYPQASNVTKEGRAKNRRVTITLER